MQRPRTFVALAAFPPLLLAPAPPEAGVELGFGWALVKMLLALLVVCVGAYLLLRYGLRRLVAPAASSRHVRVVERCPLSASRALWIVGVGRRSFLIGEAEGSISMLAELPADELASGAPAPASGFLQLLRRGAVAPAPVPHAAPDAETEAREPAAGAAQPEQGGGQDDR